MAGINGPHFMVRTTTAILIGQRADRHCLRAEDASLSVSLAGTWRVTWPSTEAITIAGPLNIRGTRVDRTPEETKDRLTRSH